jgi:hypothetical protein
VTIDRLKRSLSCDSPLPPRAVVTSDASATTPAKTPPVDVAERTQTMAHKRSGLDAGAARVHLTEALRGAQAIVISDHDEAAMAELVKLAALDPAAFAREIAGFSPQGDRSGLVVLFEMRKDAIAAEIGDATEFLRRCESIAMKLK